MRTESEMRLRNTMRALDLPEDEQAKYIAALEKLPEADATLLEQMIEASDPRFVREFFEIIKEKLALFSGFGTDHRGLAEKHVDRLVGTSVGGDADE